jgi:polysaccharide pyruvyl transferase WcaK-like protein
MHILFDQAIYDMRNKGNVALLEVAVTRIHAMWPNALLGVLTLSPHLLSLYCSQAIPVRPDGCGAWQKDGLRYKLLHRWVPRFVWRFMFELREAFWRRNSASPLAAPSVPSKAQPLQEQVTTGEEKGVKIADELDGAHRYASLVADTDLFISTGAQYMSDACRDDALEVLNRFEAAIDRGIPTAMVGQGFGPMKDPILVERSRTVLPRIDFIFARDRVASPQLLASLGVDPSRICLTGDDAVELAYEARTRTLGTNIGVGLRAAHYTELNSDHVMALRSALQTAAKKHGSKLVSIPISHSAHEMDDLVIRQLLVGYPIGSSDWRRFDSPHDIIRKVGRCRLVVAGTFHATVFALAQGIPAVGVAQSAMYVDKFLGLIDFFGPGCQIVRLDDPQMEQNLGRAIEVAWSSAEQLRPALLEAAKRQIGLGQAAYQRIFELVETRKPSGIKLPGAVRNRQGT